MFILLISSSSILTYTIRWRKTIFYFPKFNAEKYKYTFKKMNISQMMLIVNNLLKKLKEASKTEVC